MTTDKDLPKLPEPDAQPEALEKAMERAVLTGEAWIQGGQVLSAQDVRVQPEAPAVLAGRMPTYGAIPWDVLKAAVEEAFGGPRRWSEEHYIGHQDAGINMNSLNRIVSKFAAAPTAQPEAPAAAAGWQMVPTNLTAQMARAWCEAGSQAMSTNSSRYRALLAAAPTAPAVQVPPMLTNEQIKATWLEKAELVSVLGFARDIEAERDKQWLAACGVRS